MISSFSLLGQEKVTLFLTSQGEVTNELNGQFRCEVEYDLQNFKLDGLLNCTFYDGSPGIKVFYKKDVKNGQCETYYRNGRLKASGKYSAGFRSGVWYYYYPNGQLHQVIKFTDDKFSRNYDSNIMVGEYYLKSGKQLLKGGKGKWINDSISYSPYSLKPRKPSIGEITGEFKDSLKHGAWTLKDVQTRKIIWTESFDLGKYVTGKAYYEDDEGIGTPFSEGTSKFRDEHKNFLFNIETFKLDSTVFPDSLAYQDVQKILEVVTGHRVVITERDAGFLHGDYALNEYIANNIRYPHDAFNQHIQGTVVVKITIGINNKAKDIEILKGIHPSLDNEALRIVKSIDYWISALSNGKPYEKTIGIPIQFVLD